jgi:DNA-binding transcriptional LysR family regulator
MVGIPIMHDMHIGAIDLNLLVALDALLVERNVTRAAKRVGITQPAMSHALARLRTLLDDDILVRSKSGMLPTARARALEEPIRRALREIEEALRARPVFDPRTAERTFAIATSDYGELVVLPPLLERLAREAPRIDLRVHAVPEDWSTPLEEGVYDLVLVPNAGDTPAGIVRQKLFDETFVCVLRKGHPAARRGLDLQTFVELPHVLIAPSGRLGGIVDEALAQRSLTRRIALTVPHFLVAPLVIASSDLLLTLAERVARTFAKMAPLEIRQPPLAVRGFAMYQSWHERRRGDPAHAWLRNLVAEVSATRPRRAKLK